MALQDTADVGDKAERKAKRAKKQERQAKSQPNRVKLISHNGIAVILVAALGKSFDGRLWDVNDKLRERLQTQIPSADLKECTVSVYEVAEDEDGIDTVGGCFALMLGMAESPKTVDVKYRIEKGGHAFNICHLDKVAQMTNAGEATGILSLDRDTVFPVLVGEDKVAFYTVSAHEGGNATWTLSKTDPHEVVAAPGPLRIAFCNMAVDLSET